MSSKNKEDLPFSYTQIEIRVPNENIQVTKDSSFVSKGLYPTSVEKTGKIKITAKS